MAEMRRILKRIKQLFPKPKIPAEHPAVRMLQSYRFFMKTYFAYIRVSSTRQGEEGVSLQEQKAAIIEYASRRGIAIGEWFEEQVTAATRGRPLFSKVVGMLKAKKALGVVIHKIDRGARNLRDWADIAELMDNGVDVHFVHEGIDLNSRSGRLSADILAVVAADYIRNLREETHKGIQGRLKQGIFPFAAPIGYLNAGRGKVKPIDPVRGPFIKRAFELYATKEYSLLKLEKKLFEEGLRTRSGKVVGDEHLAMILRNPFYMGLMRLRGRKETYPGLHTPLISSALFNTVQLIITGKRSKLRTKNRFLFSRLIFCQSCHLNLCGELQKNHIYYYCHRKQCPPKCVREERFREAVLECLRRATFSPDEEMLMREALINFKSRETEAAKAVRRKTEAELDSVRASIRTLVQRFLDDAISKEDFDENHGELLLKRKTWEERLTELSDEQFLYERIKDLLERSQTLVAQFCSSELLEARKAVEFAFDRFEALGKEVSAKPKHWLEAIASRERTAVGWNQLLDRLCNISPNE